MIVRVCKDCNELFILTASIHRDLLPSSMCMARHLIKVHEWLDEMDKHELGCVISRVSHEVQS